MTYIELTPDEAAWVEWAAASSIDELAIRLMDDAPDLADDPDQLQVIDNLLMKIMT